MASTACGQRKYLEGLEDRVALVQREIQSSGRSARDVRIEGIPLSASGVHLRSKQISQAQHNAGTVRAILDQPVHALKLAVVLSWIAVNLLRFYRRECSQ